MYFLLPVAQGAHRRDDQYGFGQAALLFFQVQVRQRLYGFSQSHVIGENAAEAMATQKLQPPETFFLVGAEGGAKAGRRGLGWDASSGVEVLEKGLQTGV